MLEFCSENTGKNSFLNFDFLTHRFDALRFGSIYRYFRYFRCIDTTLIIHTYITHIVLIYLNAQIMKSNKIILYRFGNDITHQYIFLEPEYTCTRPHFWTSAAPKFHENTALVHILGLAQRQSSTKIQKSKHVYLIKRY